MNAEQAKVLVEKYYLPINVPFFALLDEEVKAVNAAADCAKYKRPKGSKGSRAHQFYKELMKHFKDNSNAPRH